MKVVAVLSALSLLLGTVHGRVMRGPIAPVCRVGVPCEAPVAHATLFFTRLGRTVSAVTDAHGYYHLELKGGLYAVKPKRASFGRGFAPRSVRIAAGGDKRADFHIDTGIR